MITQEMVDRLKPGMSRSQVKFVLGTPLVVDTLNNDQWHYIYSLRLGNGKLLQKKLYRQLCRQPTKRAHWRL